MDEPEFDSSKFEVRYIWVISKNKIQLFFFDLDSRGFFGESVIDETWSVFG